MTETATETTFNPADHTVAETQEYLATADGTEVQRVKDAEAAGANRKGIMEWEPAPSAYQPDDDGYTRIPVPEDEAYPPGDPLPEDDQDEDTDDEV
jgi:hypothetical protein